MSKHLVSHLLTLLNIGTAFIKFGKRTAALFHDRLGTDIKIAYQTFMTILCFNLRFPLPTLFCSNAVYRYTCSCDKNTYYIGSDEVPDRGREALAVIVLFMLDLLN